MRGSPRRTRGRRTRRRALEQSARGIEPVVNVSSFLGLAMGVQGTDHDCDNDHDNGGSTDGDTSSVRNVCRLEIPYHTTIMFV